LITQDKKEVDEYRLEVETVQESKPEDKKDDEQRSEDEGILGD